MFGCILTVSISRAPTRAAPARAAMRAAQVHTRRLQVCLDARGARRCAPSIVPATTRASAQPVASLSNCCKGSYACRARRPISTPTTGASRAHPAPCCPSRSQIRATRVVQAPMPRPPPHPRAYRVQLARTQALAISRSAPHACGRRSPPMRTAPAASRRPGCADRHSTSTEARRIARRARWWRGNTTDSPRAPRRRTPPRQRARAAATKVAWPCSKTAASTPTAYAACAPLPFLCPQTPPPRCVAGVLAAASPPSPTAARAQPATRAWWPRSTRRHACTTTAVGRVHTWIPLLSGKRTLRRVPRVRPAHTAPETADATRAQTAGPP